MGRRTSGQTARREPPPPQRRKQIALAAVAHIPVLLLLITMIAAVLTIPGETVRFGRRGAPGMLLPALPVQIVVLTILIPLAAVVLFRSGQGLHLFWAGRQSPPSALVLEPGEVIAWAGRQGWRGIERHRLVLALLAGLGPTLYASGLWSIWTGSDTLVLRLFWSFGATMLLAGTVALLPSAPTRALLNDVFGTMTITDRRIAWCGPRRDLYRELVGTDIIDAAFVEGDARRAWIALTRMHRDRVSEIDLFGVPRPIEALQAIDQMMARTADEGEA